MKKIFFLPLVLCTLLAVAQPPEDVKTLQVTARNFMVAGDYNNAIVVLNRGLQMDKNNLELQKDLVQAYYLKQDYAKALEGVQALIDRDDVDVMTFQIAGNVYKALEETKAAEKMYKKALKKFPKAGPLYSEYGELLFAINDYSAIDYWEKGIEVDPAFGGNYYNAAMYYFYTKDKVWSIIYGEIFCNMESLSERGAAMKDLVLKSYTEKLFVDADLFKDQDKYKSDFSKAFLTTMSKQAALTSKGLSIEALTMIRTRFILDWYAAYGSKYPFRLFDYHQQLIKEGMFEAYNQWLFGPVKDLVAYEGWTKAHGEQYNAFNNFQKNRVFKLPAGQYYQAKN
jgi:tetratricopeptide (TPR) repeat protein